MSRSDDTLRGSSREAREIGPINNSESVRAVRRLNVRTSPRENAGGSNSMLELGVCEGC